jgi:raffinose/stachyose/melibiose transport system permease protein
VIRRRQLGALLFIVPAAAIYGTFVLSPFVQTVWLSFHKWDGASPLRVWIGLGNYLAAARDEIFWRALSHNLVFIGMNLLLPTSLGLLLAALVAQVRRGRTVYRFGLFLPYVLSLAIVGIIWGRIYDPTIGILNQVLRAVGLEALTRPWLGDANAALVAVNLAGVWHAFPFAMVIYLAGLQGIDTSLYDAARIDGANGAQTFRHVTVPSLRNVTTLLLSGAFISALTAFTLVWTMTGGGPYYATEVISTYIYKRAFEDIYVGYGAALSVCLAVVALTATGLFVWQRERGE